MVTEIKGTVKDFKDAIQLMSGMKSDKDMLFSQIVLCATKDLIKSMSFFKGGGVFTMSEFRNFDVNIGDDKEMLIPIDVVKFVKFLKVGPSSELITVTYDGKTMKIKTETDEITIPGVTIKSIESHRKKPPFKIDEEGNPLYNKGKDKPTTIIEMDASIFKGVIERSKLTGTEYYPIEFRKPDKLIAQCGDEKDRKTASIKHIRDDITVEGKNLKVTLAQGFNEVFSVLSGNVELMGTSKFPMWVVKATADYRVCYFLSPLKETE